MDHVPDIVVAGEIFIDLLFSGLDQWPEPGKEIFAKRFQREIGGGTAITACALAKLGSICGVFACVGEDTRAWMADRLASFGVSTDALCVSTGEPTAITVVATQPHERAFLTYSGANGSFEREFLEALRSRKPIARRHVHLAFAPGVESGPEVFERLHGQGCSVSLDVGWREDWLCDARAHSLLEHVDIFFPNEAEACRMSRERDAAAMLKWCASRGARRVVLKLGARGAAMLWDGSACFLDPHVVTPVDTTGAGDCFDAGFLHFWTHGADAETCLRAANICGALSTEGFGGVGNLPSADRVAMELKKGTR